MPTNYKLAIKHLNSQTQFRVSGDPEVYDNITFTGVQTYTQAELDAAWLEREALPPIAPISYSEADDLSYSTSNKWVQKNRLTFGSSDGEYLIEWSAEGGAKRNNTQAAFQCELDDSISISSFNVRLNNMGFTPISGFKKVVLSAGSHTVDIDYRTTSSKKPVFLQNARIKVTQLT